MHWETWRRKGNDEEDQYVFSVQPWLEPFTALTDFDSEQQGQQLTPAGAHYIKVSIVCAQKLELRNSKHSSTAVTPVEMFSHITSHVLFNWFSSSIGLPETVV